ncbi:MupG family TIM beta-alpha barrel fold protein [Enterococcus columbae]|uniref:Outer surface protein n=1 Tax=Enterococcus columbae DSM 7374 = ATCC 51263 TaxID=1121865 RepID=S0KY94_9ENTE|nr:MupG family TIM beta-alpha barrel fold protein [Enterococcus columbae]EOT44236.1 hypothetical protein OMW_00291 [Enterococcus columbae DSM 7374 = ATCC 51263]EOW84394.1 hypothetical protein I568_00889 [Enterococcus columbae DSM 7374 = ATCC 51263]OJG26046.1 hypothetical protein RR47_GL000844 [Enterococcus columbae DSM 7374 = ATCC 51263]
MLGFSIYLNETNDTISKKINHMKSHGFSVIFSSINLPEYNKVQVDDKINFLLSIIKNMGMKLILDVNNVTVNEYSIIEKIAYFDLTSQVYLRLDDGFSLEKIINIAEKNQIVLNASTLTTELILELEKQNLDFTKVLACHNYYPREDTGLDEKYFQTINKQLRNKKIKTIAFFGNSDATYARGPIFSGLPTLEIHRYSHPLVSAINLLEKYNCDYAILSDLGLSNEMLDQFDYYFCEKTVLLRVTEVNFEFQAELLSTHCSRNDISKNVIRCQQSRRRNNGVIRADVYPKARVVGSVTLDNENYLRYMGELQITKIPLAADRRVNKIAQVIDEDLELLLYITSGRIFKFKIV